MVSITDHGTISAPCCPDRSQRAPDSGFVEWSAPYGPQSFHLGVHNLPSARATAWMASWPITPTIPPTRA